MRDSLPEYLGQLVDALSTTIDRTDARIKADRVDSIRVGSLHGSDRAGSLNYSMNQLIYEYHILRQVICDVMEEEAILSPAEREIIVASIEQAVNDAATQYSETLREIQERLSNTIAHDLRGPLTAAKSSAQLIMRRPDNVDHCMRNAALISLNMDRLDSMIHDLLDASKVKAGQRLNLDVKECDLDLIARQVADEGSLSYGNRFQIHSTGKCLGYWDENGIRRVIENLSTNAVKYSSPNTPITICIQRVENSVKLSVHNRGAPILKEDQVILFQQFRRIRSKGNKIGWGLGLVIVKGMVEAHRGSIHVESNEEKGTTFTIELPIDSRKLKIDRD